MNKSAVLHIPMSQYAYPEAEDVFTIRFRTAKGDLDRCDLFWGDRACNTSPVTFTRCSMEVKWQDILFDYYEVTLTNCPKRICYYFVLHQGDEESYYYSDHFHTSLPDRVLDNGFVVEARSEYYQYPYILREEIPSQPEWFQNAIVYNIFPDSFANGKQTLMEMYSGKDLTPVAPETYDKEWVDKSGMSHRSRHGGTIRGILENLDYIQNLGFNCLYLNPIFGSGEYHKYDIFDYYHIDPTLGTDEDFASLTKAIHDRGMHIIIDGVFNHCSWYFDKFEDVIKNGEQSIYKDWFYELSYPVVRPTDGTMPNYACFAYEPKMPKLNTSNSKVQDYFAAVGRYWIEKYHVDGWRLDVANEIDRNFWRKFRLAVKSISKDIVLIGEVWENSESWLKGDAFDSTMNYDFRNHCRDFFGGNGETAKKKLNGDAPKKKSNGDTLQDTIYGDTALFAANMTDMMLRYPMPIARGQLNLLDSHDVARFLSFCDDNLTNWKCAFVYLMMAPGVPSVFYGDEKEIMGYTEPEYRSPMPWSEDHHELEAFVKKLIQIRKDYISPQDDWTIESVDGCIRMIRSGLHKAYNSIEYGLFKECNSAENCGLHKVICTICLNRTIPMEAEGKVLIEAEDGSYRVEVM